MAKLLGGTRIYGNATIDTSLSVAGNIAAGNISIDAIAANTWIGLTSTSVQEGNNLYYTNSRVYSNVVQVLAAYATVANLNLKANTASLTTANVTESASNLYYTVARANTAIDNRVTKAFVENLNITVTNASHATTADTATNAGYATTAGSAGTVSSISNFTTSDLVEGTNLYYSNDRVYANVIGLLNAKANVTDLTTTNVAEGNNLYYTNARARTALTSGTGVSYDVVTGAISIGQNVSPNASVTFANLNVTGTVNLYGNVTTHSSNNLSISDNMIYLNNGSEASNPDVGFAFNYNDGVYHHGGFFRDASDGIFKAFDNYSPEPDANIFIDTNHATFRLANIAATTFYGNLVGTISSLSNFSTSNLVEGINLYYTNARVYSNVSPLLAVKANIADLTTANVLETASGLYYTNARVLSNVQSYLAANPQTSTYSNANVAAYLATNTGNISAGNVIANSFVATGAGAGSISSGADFNITATGNINLSASGIRSSNIFVEKITANVWSGLIAGNNIIIAANGQISANLAAASGGAASSVLATGVIGLNTANVSESASNLYYTNARVLSNVVAYLAANPQGGSYANSNVAAYLATYTGNVSAGNVIANSFVATGAGAGSISSGADFNITATGNINLSASNVFTSNFVANKVTSNIWSGIYTANVTESSSSLYYTNARVYSNVAPLLSAKANVTDLTTSNVVETSSGLYYTNARVASNVLALLPTLAGDNISIAANGRISATASGGISSASLTTANVIESSNNLYYTNARVASNVSSLLQTYSGNIAAGNLALSGGYGGSLTGANLISANNLSAVNWLGLYSSNVVGLNTANVNEFGSNLYYTNTRVLSNILALLPTLAGNNIIIAANGQISANLAAAGGGAASSVLATGVIGLNTANVSESSSNLYYTNARVYSNVVTALSTYSGNIAAGNLALSGGYGGSLTGANLISANNLSAVNWLGLYAANVVGLTTANVPEITNLYYTNARTRSAISAGTGVSYDNSTGVISISQNVSTTANVTFGALNITGVTNFYGNVITHSSNNLSISDNMIYLNAGSESSNPDLGIAGNYNDGTYRHTGFFRDATDGVWKVFDSYTPEPDANIFIDTSHATFRLANLAATSFTGNVVGNVTGYVSSISNFTTSNLTEGNNLYYTNARVYSNVISLVNAKANVTDLTTANVTESASALYYTNARVLSNVTAYLAANPQGGYANANVAAYLATNTGNINAGNVIANSFVSATSGTGTLTATGDFNILSGGNIRLTGNVYANTFISTATGTGSITSTTNFNINAAANVNITASNINLNSGNIVTTGNITATKLSATIWQNIYTANVVESGSLYYTNARVYSNVSPLLSAKANVTDLTTANVTETSSGLYYTNARVYSNVISLLNAKANVTDLTTANVTETASGLYYTNARVASNVLALLPTLAGDNITIAANGRISATASGGGSVTSANLTTANVVEIASNLYFTNARVYSNVASMLATYTGNVNAGNLSVQGGSGGTIGGANLISTNVISALVWTGLYAANVSGLNTANVAETASGLYYTNARVYSNIIALLPQLAGNNIIIAANGQISANLAAAGGGAASSVLATGVIGLNTANVSESSSNLYYTNTRVYANVVSMLATYTGNINGGNLSILSGSGGTIGGANLISTNIISATTWTGLYAANVVGLTTANVSEITNLYYTNARVRSTLSGGTGVSYDTSTGVISIGQNVATTANVTFGALNVTGVTNFYGNVITHSSNNLSISDNMIYLNAGSESSNPDLGISGNYNDGTYHHAGFFRDASDNGTWKVFENYSPEPDANIFIDTNHATFRLANLSATTFTGNVVGNVTGFVNSISNFSTSNLTEGNNLYYTNARVYANVITLLNAKANVTDLTTSNIVEINNLFYTNARVYSNVLALLPTLAGDNITIAANGRISSTASGGVSSASLTTANVIETASNLYFTNARVVSALSAGSGITIAANGQISGGVSTVTSSQTFSGGNTNITLATSVSDEKRIIVTIDGLVQIPVTDYTVSGTTLTLIPTPSPNSTIEVKFFGNESISITGGGTSSAAAVGYSLIFGG